MGLRASLPLLTVLLLALFSSSHGTQYVLEYGSKLTSGVAAPLAQRLLPVLVTEDYSGQPLPSFDLVASTPSWTQACTYAGECWVWGSTQSTRWLPRKISPTNAPPPLIRLSALQDVFYGLTSSGNVYTWSFFDAFTDNTGLNQQAFGRSISSTIQPTVGALPSSVTSPLVVTMPGTTPVSDLQCSFGEGPNGGYCLMLDSLNTTFYITTSSPTIYNTLGLNTSASWVSPKADAVPSGQVALFTAGASFYCFVTTTSVTYCSGDNTYGQLGLLSPTTPSHMALHPNLNSLAQQPVAIAAGSNHGLWLAPNGTIWCWGDNSYGQLGGEAIFGNPSYVQLAQVALPVASGIVAISAVESTSFALLSNGTMFVWGATYMPGVVQGETLAQSFFPFPIMEDHAMVGVTLPGVAITSLPQAGLAAATSSLTIRLMARVTSTTRIGYDPLRQAYSGPVSIENTQLALWGTLPASFVSVASDNPSIVVEAGIPPGNYYSPVGMDHWHSKTASPNGRIGPYYTYFPSHNVTAILDVVTQGSSIMVKALVNDDATPKYFFWGNFIDFTELYPLVPVAKPTSYSSFPLDITDELSQIIELMSGYQPDILEASFNSFGLVAIVNYTSALPPTLAVVAYNSLTSSAIQLNTTFVHTPYDYHDLRCGRGVCGLLSSGDFYTFTVHPAEVSSITSTAEYGWAANAPVSPTSFVGLYPVALSNDTISVIDAQFGFGFGVLWLDDPQDPKNIFQTWGNPYEVASGLTYDPALGFNNDNSTLFGYGASQPMPIDTTYINSTNYDTLKVISYCVGYHHVLVLLQNNEVISWGDNSQGQLGRTTVTSEDYLPMEISSSWLPNTTTFDDLACVAFTSFLLTSNGVYAWGLNGVGNFYGTSYLYNIFNHPIIGWSSVGADGPFYVEQAVPDTYIAKIFSSPSAFSVTALMQVTNNLTVATSPAPDTLPTAFTELLAFGTESTLKPVSDPAFASTYALFAPWNKDLAGEEMDGVSLDVADIGLDYFEDVNLVALTDFTRFYLTTYGRLFAAGVFWSMPQMDVTYNNYTSAHQSPVFITPQLLWVFDPSTIVNMQSFTEGVAILLNSGNVMYWTAYMTPVWDVYAPLISAVNPSDPASPNYLSVPGNDYIYAMSCDATACCFAGYYTQTLYCYGSKTNGFSPSAAPLLSSSTPDNITNFYGADVLVMSSRGGYVSIDYSGDWIFYPNGAALPTNLTGELAGQAVWHYAAGYAHIVALTQEGLFVAGWDDVQSIMLNNGVVNSAAPFSPFVSFAPEYNSSIALVTAWTHSIIFVTYDGNIYVAGFLFGKRDLFDPTLDAFFPFSSLPSLHNTTVSGYFIDALFNKRVYNTYIPAGNTPTLFPIRPPEPVFVARAKPNPSPSALLCDGVAPFYGCYCSQGSWVCSGNVDFNSPDSLAVTISSPIVINGNWLVSTSSLVIQITDSMIRKFGAVTNTSSSLARVVPVALNVSAIIQVTGCANIKQPVTLSLENVSLPIGMSNISIVESSCNSTNITNPFALSPSQKNACTSLRTEKSTDPTTRRTTLTAVFNMPSGGCGNSDKNLWWIITVAAIGGVIALAGIVVSAVVFSKRCRKVVQPYHGTSGRSAEARVRKLSKITIQPEPEKHEEPDDSL